MQPNINEEGNMNNNFERTFNLNVGLYFNQVD